MALDLGAVIARVVWEDAGFVRGYTRAQMALRRLAAQAGATASGVHRLDAATLASGRSATRAAAAAEKQAAATRRQGTTAAMAARETQRQAAAYTRLSEAQKRTSAIMAATARQSTRSRIAALQNAAAQERLAAASAEAGSAAQRQAQANARLMQAQAASLASSKRFAAHQALSATAMVSNGRKASRALTLPILAAGAVAVHEAAQFEQATNVYVTAAGESSKNLGVVRDGLKRIAVETGTSIDNLTEAEYTLQKAGYRGADGIKVLDASAKGAREENANLADVVQAMTSIMAAYNLPASKSVQVMNALKTGAGSAKVSMEDYTRALSTALPIAAQFHIGVDQLLGSYSQLTQQGNTAQYSTQVLFATIRALGKPNRVASKQMQQLGLDVNDVQTKLGERGITGTLRLYVGAITKHLGKGGLVVQDAFNKQASAMQDVNVMLGKMPAQTRNVSKAYLDGKVSLKDWRDNIKALPTDQAAIARNFATVADRTHAFNDLLKAGDPAAQTFAGALSKMTNGSIGMNAVLQLMGNNFEGVETRAAAVGKSLNNTSHEVEGWHSTAELASVKADKLKASLHTMAIDAGTDLLPMFKRLVDGVSDVVHWFSGLSDTSKSFAGWGLAIAAGIGPAMFVMGKLRLMGIGMARFAGAAEATRNRVGLAMQGMAVALAGVGLLSAGGNAAKGAKKDPIKGVESFGLNVAGGAAIGAGIGSAVPVIGTGVGAAVGALGGAIKSLVDIFGDSGDAAEEAANKQEAAAQRARAAVEAQKQAVEALTQAIDADSDAIGANVRQQVVSDLSKTKGSGGKNALQLAQSAGIDPKLITDATLGNQKAKSQLQAAIDKIGQSTVKGGTLVANGQQANAVAQLLPLLEKEGVLLQQGGQAADLKAQATNGLNLATRDLATQTRFYGAALPATGKALKDQSIAERMNVQYIRDHAAALGTARKKGQLTDAQWGKQTKTLQKQLGAYGFNKRAVSGYIASFSNIPKSVATRLLADPKNAKGAIGDVLRGILRIPPKKNTKLDANTNAVISKVDQVGQMLSKLTGQPYQVGINATGNALATANSLQSKLDALAGRHVVVTTEIRTTHSADHKASDPRAGGNDKKPGGATGMDRAPDGYFAVGEEGPEVVRKRGAHVQIFSNADSRELIRQTGWQFPGFAKGTKKSGSNRVGDTEYASKRAADNARRRKQSSKDKERAAAAESRVSSALGNVGQAYSPRFSLDEVGYSRVDQQIDRAQKVLGEQIKKGLSKKAAASARAELRSLRKMAESQLRDLRLRIKGSDVKALRNAIKGTADDVRNAFATILTDARNAGASKSVLRALNSAQTRLVNITNALGKAREKLDTLRDFRTGITDTLSGDFDVSKFGSVQDFLAGTGDQTAANQKYKSEVDLITQRSKGNKTLAALANDLAGKGNSIGLETLANASPAELAQITKAYGGYTSSLLAGGDSATKLKYGQTVGGQTTLVAGLVKGQSALVSSVALLATAVDRPVQLKINGHPIAVETVKDPVFNEAIGALLRAAGKHKTHKGKK